MEKKPFILIVEDDDHTLELIATVLETNGYEIETQQSGRAALASIKKKTPDLIISDIMMPEMNGLELIKTLKLDPVKSQIPFLFLSAKISVHDRVKGLDLGADDYICKPFMMEELLARVKSRLRINNELQIARRSEGELSGDLSIFPVIDLIQILKLEKKTGEIRVMDKTLKAEIRINSGEIVDVSYGDYSGLKAFRSIIAIQKGRFSFLSSETMFEEKIKLNTQELIVESARQLDEFRFAISKIPPLDQIYETNQPILLKDLSADNKTVLDLFDGRQKLENIIKNSPIVDVETVRSIRHLITEGLVKKIGTSENGSHHKGMLKTLGNKQYETFVNILKEHPGEPSIIIIGLEDVNVDQFISNLCDCLTLGKYDVSLKPASSMICTRVSVDEKYSVNLYGLHGVKQFSFLWQILGHDILGIFLISDKTSAIQEKSVKSFFNSLQNDFQVPCVTVIIDKEQSMGNGKKESAPHLDTETTSLFNMGSVDTVAAIFTQWCEIVKKSI